MYVIRYNYSGGPAPAINPDDPSWQDMPYRNRLNMLQIELQNQFVFPPQPLGLSAGELNDWNYIMGVAKNQYYLSVHNVLVGLRLLSNVFENFFPKPAKVAGGNLEAFSNAIGYNSNIVPQNIVDLFQSFEQLLTDNPTIAQVRAFLSQINIYQYVQSIQNFFNDQASVWNDLTPSWNDKYLSHKIGIDPFARTDNFNDVTSPTVIADNEYPGHHLWNIDPAAMNAFLNGPSDLTWYWNTIWPNTLNAKDYGFLLQYATGGGTQAAADAASLTNTFNPTQSAIFRYTAYQNQLTTDAGGEQALNAILQAKQYAAQQAKIQAEETAAAQQAQQAAEEIATAKAAQAAAAQQQAAAQAATAQANEAIQTLKTGVNSMNMNMNSLPMMKVGMTTPPTKPTNPYVRHGAATPIHPLTPQPQQNIDPAIRAGTSPVSAPAVKNAVMAANPPLTQGTTATVLTPPPAQSPKAPTQAAAPGSVFMAGLKAIAANNPMTNSTSPPATKTATTKKLSAIGLAGIAIGLLFLL